VGRDEPSAKAHGQAGGPASTAGVPQLAIYTFLL